MYNAVVFDLDHTLFDRYATFKSILNNNVAYTVFNNTLTKEEILSRWTYADKNYIYANNAWDLVYDYLKEKNVLKPNILKENFFEKNIKKLYMLAAIPYTDTISTLEALKSKNIKLGIITNGAHNLQYKKIELLGIEKYFDEIIISGDYRTNKPDVKLFNIMTNRLNINPQKALFVGDHPVNDINGARNAGYKTVWLNATGNRNCFNVPRADYEINALNEILNII